jgi:transposase
MRKGTYRAVEIKSVNMARVAEAVKGKRVAFAVDVGKEVPFARVVTNKKELVVTVKWKQPGQRREVIEWLGQLGAERVEVVMEPTGTYGDALRAQAWAAGLEVYRVNPKRVHDAAETYDGVPSHHDAKSAAIVADLHLDGASEPWPLRPEQERELGASVKLLELYQEALLRMMNH